MKKLYFLNEEESNRILNLHKDATKRQYIKEQTNLTPDQLKALNSQIKTQWNQNPPTPTGKEALAAGWGPISDDAAAKLPVDGNGKIIPKVTTPSPKPEITTPEVKKPIQSVNKPLVMDIQKKLREKDIYIGNTGLNKDGVDGDMGKLTLDGIIKLLGGPEPLKTIDLTTKPLAKKSTEDLMKPVTPVVAGATPETPEAAAAAAAAAAATAATAAAADKGEDSSKEP